MNLNKITKAKYIIEVIKKLPVAASPLPIAVPKIAKIKTPIIGIVSPTQAATIASPNGIISPLTDNVETKNVKI